MKKIKFITLVLALLSLAACSQGPETAAEGFVINLSGGDIAKAKEYATPNTAGIIDFAASMGRLPTDPNAKFIFVEKVVSDDGKRAVVRFKVSDNSKIDKIDLVKLDGTWKVAMKK